MRPAAHICNEFAFTREVHPWHSRLPQAVLLPSMHLGSMLSSIFQCMCATSSLLICAEDLHLSLCLINEAIQRDQAIGTNMIQSTPMLLPSHVIRELVTAMNCSIPYHPERPLSRKPPRVSRCVRICLMREALEREIHAHAHSEAASPASTQTLCLLFQQILVVSRCTHNICRSWYPQHVKSRARSCLRRGGCSGSWMLEKATQVTQPS